VRRSCAALLVVLAAFGCEREGAHTQARQAPPPRLAFPESFRFGAATSAHQVEGGQVNSWTLFETLPVFEGKTVEPSGEAVDHYARFEEDLDLAASIHLDTYRFSIEWSRVEPEEGSFDEEEIRHYRDVLEAMQERGLGPSVTLHHFSEPTWLAELGSLTDPVSESFCPRGPEGEQLCSWLSPRAVQVFARFCARAASEYGDLVDEWMSFNELTGYWMGAFVTGHFPPGLAASDEEEIRERALPALRRLLEAHAACYRAIHENDTHDADGDGAAARVGLTVGTGMARPAKQNNEADMAAAEQAQLAATWQVFDALTEGRLDLDLDGTADETHDDWAGTVDIMGLQYYASTVVVALKALPLLEGVPCINSDDEGLMKLARYAGCPEPPTQDFPLGLEAEPSVYGRQHDPDGLTELLELIAARYPGLPVVITEQGFADHEVKRAGSIVRHLRAAHEAISLGIPLEGYYHWSLLDNFEWGRGFGVRFGLFSVDYDSDLERSPTVASEVYGEIARRRGITDELLELWDGSGALPTERPLPKAEP